MNIYILTELTKRELDSNLLLACIAAENNFDIIISNSATIKFLNDKKLLKKGLFHTKSLVHGDKKKQLHESLKKNDIKISSIDEETFPIKLAGFFPQHTSRNVNDGGRPTEIGLVDVYGKTIQFNPNGDCLTLTQP